MFWSNKPPAPGPSSSTRSASISRNTHLQSYLNHHVLMPSTRKVSNDGTIYDTVFQTTNGFALILRVYLPLDLSRAPTMTLHGVRASHNWLDIRMKVIGYTPISTDQRWKSSNLKLGDAVYAVIHHFQLTPPSVLEITDANLKRLQSQLSGGTTNSRQAPQPTSNNSPFPSSASGGFHNQRTNNDNSMHMNNSTSGNHQQSVVQNGVIAQKVNYEVADDEVDTLIPPIPSSFPEINAMPLSEVKRVVDNKEVMETFVESTSAVKTLRELKQSIEASNVDAAKTNLLDHEDIVKEVYTEVETLEQELNTKIEQYKKLDAERMAMTNPPDLQDAIKELTKAKKEAYRESEELADEWVESGGENVSDFVKQFMEVRMLYHTRAAKAERLEMSM